MEIVLKDKRTAGIYVPNYSRAPSRDASSMTYQCAPAMESRTGISACFAGIFKTRSCQAEWPSRSPNANLSAWILTSFYIILINMGKIIIFLTFCTSVTQSNSLDSN